MKTLGNGLFFVSAVAACILPLAWFGVPNSSTDLEITILARTLASQLFWQHGFYHRVPQILSGVDALPSGMFAIKLDSLFMALVTSSTGVLLLLLARCTIFIALTATILCKVYGASFRVAVGLAACASAGLNILNWLYYGPDYVGGGLFGWGYPLFALLLCPMALEEGKRLSVVALMSFGFGVLYGASSLYFIAIFGGYVAFLWVVLRPDPLRHAVSAAAGLAGVLLAIAPELLRFMQTSAASGTRSTFALFFDWRQTWDILIHRDVSATRIGLALAAVALGVALWRPAARAGIAVLAVVYVLSMLLDPVMKTMGPDLQGVLPTFVLSVSYYSYVFSPIVLVAILAASFRHVRGIAEVGLAVALVAIALKLTSSGLAAGLVPREGPGLAVIRAVARELQARDVGLQRAVVIRETGADFENAHWRLARLSPNHFAAFGLAMADGYIPNPDARYALFMSNVAIPPGAGSVTRSRFERNVVLDVPVSSHLKEAAGGCLAQETAIPVDDYLSLPILQNAAVRYVISMFRLESRHLVLRTGGNPVFCPTGRGEGRPFVYEFVTPVFRFALAREITTVEDPNEAYDVLRADPSFAISDRAVVAKEEAGRLRAPVSGIGAQSGEVTLLADSGDRLRLRVSTPMDSLLIVRDSYSQPITARTEDEELDVIRINGSFVGVRVPRGIREIAMTFQ